MGYDLPTSVDINGESYSIRYDFRVALDIFEALNDAELSDGERALAVLQMFYVDFEQLRDYNAAIRECMKFLNGGKEEQQEKKQTRLVSWKQDFPYLVAPINRVLGFETRSVPYDPEENTGGVHWWTFLSAYMEIGDCLFAQIVGIRAKRARGKRLDKSEQEFYRKNRDLVDIQVQYTEQENELLKMWAK